ncbi:MAG: Murein DD-endopeptidase MepM [Elusimicrobia bacterium ADurb.Bin231]|nr:MAG: Murein DD-endopeptidase MepM [Elusimicrobia bacterium ADurb.Bin231]
MLSDRVIFVKNKFFKIIIYVLIAVIVFAVAASVVFRAYYVNTGPEIIVSSGTVCSGDTLSGIFSQANIIPQDAAGINSALSAQFNPRKIKPDNNYEIFTTTDGGFVKFNYWESPMEYYSVSKTSSGIFSCEKNCLPVEKNTNIIKGSISSTLYDAMQKNGASNEMIMNISDIFSWQIDFFNDPRKDDEFAVVYNEYSHNGSIIHQGEILAARYKGSYSGEHTAVYFESSDGKIKGFFAPSGNSMRKMFLKAPLNYRRISSHFSYGRVHPILRYVRPHLGIDYAANIGTPVSAIGDGIVIYAGWKGDYGKMIKIKHNASYTSLYGHLSAISKGIKRGAVVKQGQVIGKVGSTGLSTGPHLDFRITQNGKYVNFLKINMPFAENIPKKYKQEFNTVSEQYLKLLDS